MSAATQYEAVIGLEVHAQLLTRTKIFCACATRFGAPPNSQVCPVCMGLPGALPVLNEEAVRLAVRAALALNLQIATRSVFARKNYFYPDLPKGYQISQYDQPVSEHGWIEVSGASDGAGGESAPPRRIGIKRLHLEEDAGKSFHPEAGGDESLIDLNRCGVPLIEIVSEPDIRTSREAAEYVALLRQLLQYTGVSDGNMDEGSLRCDVNISVRPVGTIPFGVKAEIKNLNSIKAVAASIDAEISRQSRVLAGGGKIVQETLLWDAKREVAVAMRSKEEAHDYRYFPEPDLHPLVLSPEFLDAERARLPELPQARRARFVDALGVSEKDAGVLAATRALADYFERAVVAYDPAKSAAAGKRVANWVQGEVLRLLKDGSRDIDAFRVTPEQLAELIQHLDRGEISNLSAKEVLAEMDRSGLGVREAIDAGGHKQISDDSALRDAILKVIAANPGPVAQVRGGKEQTFAFLVGQVMKATRGAANPQVAQQILREEIERTPSG
ncbi:MAG: Asp-tRNA(Asn)/Glu-tRNA(Gln) amidotransferase subunit GatB [bacterium]